MKLHEEFKLYETMWDDANAVLEETFTTPQARTFKEKVCKQLIKQGDKDTAGRLWQFEVNITDSIATDTVKVNIDTGTIDVHSGLTTEDSFDTAVKAITKAVNKKFLDGMTDKEIKVKKLLCKLLIDQGNRDFAEKLWKYDFNFSKDASEIKLDTSTATIIIPAKQGYTYGKILDTITDAFKNIHVNESLNEAEALDEAVSTVYSGNLRAYAYYGDTPKNQRNFDHTNVNAPYTDPDNLASSPSDDYIFSGTREAWIKKLNKIAKHHQIVQLDIADEQDHEVFYAADMDPNTEYEYEDIRVFKNELFKGYEPFMKQFVIQSDNTSKITEAMDNRYYVELRAYDKNTVEEYDDLDNAGMTSEYGYWGTKEEIANKLNQIAEICDFSFVFVYEGDPYDNNCVFEASDTDVMTDEEFDNPVIWKNNFIKNAPFMKDFYTSKP